LDASAAGRKIPKLLNGQIEVGKIDESRPASAPGIDLKRSPARFKNRFAKPIRKPPGTD